MLLRRIAGLLSPLLLASTIMACGHVRADRSGHAGSVIHASAQAPAVLPDGYGPIMSLVGDPNGSGVWFWDSTTSEVAVFHLDGLGNLTTWPVLSGAAYQSQEISGFAVTATEVAWLGINSTLIRLDLKSGKEQIWKIPSPADNLAAESYLPTDLKGQHLVHSITVAPDAGLVAIAMTHSSSVELFDASAGTFAEVAMPTASEEPVAVAYAPDGSLGIGLADYKTHLQNTAVVVAPGAVGSPTVVPVSDSTSVSSYGPSGFVFGADHPVVVNNKGAVTPIALPSVPFNPPESGSAVSVMPNGVSRAALPPLHFLNTVPITRSSVNATYCSYNVG